MIESDVGWRGERREQIGKWVNLLFKYDIQNECTHIKYCSISVGMHNTHLWCVRFICSMENRNYIR